MDLTPGGQLKNHPLRRALVETLVATDIVKKFLHCGRRALVSFYRDSKGTEVDLIISTGAGHLPVEIKSSTTYSSDLSRGIKQFRSGASTGRDETGLGADLSMTNFSAF
ncbi:MAG: DUF4143 domain-containing protein [Spirochaetaceae bacterium]|nr:MAG: DUF4143 domain-containing protein [Spirochaetaceae bacterium]